MNTKWEFEQKHLKLDDGRYYIPDFYIPKSNTIIEIKGRLSDTKGIQKYKLAKKKYKQYNFEFVGPNEYSQLEKMYSNKIKNWETKKFNIKSSNWTYL